MHEVRSAVSQIVFVSCGQGVALVPLSLQRLASANVQLVPLAENVRITTTAAAWHTGRNHVLLEKVLGYLKTDESGQMPT